MGQSQEARSEITPGAHLAGEIGRRQGLSAGMGQRGAGWVRHGRADKGRHGKRARPGPGQGQGKARARPGQPEGALGRQSLGLHRAFVAIITSLS